ncbi:transcription factor SOX-3 isoform X2 [Aethina tumida]|uniref:transcription factor SOX-3 isoform X2 n=1 Tax=Aethina tumida TaxID=116153 RepID=UPI00096B6141|nr:transcription factor SOX-3 isoform X2 [Aethina tumida]
MNFCQKQDADESAPPEPPDQGKIPRPLNAFMLYANENRKTVAQMYPAESNKEISKKLGLSWRTLSVQEKNKYYQRAKIIDSEHKKKYPNYVYNPKEARIRKGIREATRDRSIGASPMLPRPSARRAASLSNWVPTHDESLIMSPLGMRQTGMDSPICFPMSGPPGTSGNGGQFLPSSQLNGGYNKLDASNPQPPPPPTSNSLHNNYMQPNPILQQQSEMWHSYQESIRPRSSGNPYMMPDVPAQYQHPRSEVATPMMLNKHHRHSVGGIAMPRTSPHTNENVPPDESRRQDKPDAGSGFESKPTEESGAVQPLMENGNMQQTGMACEQFMGGSYGQNMSHEQASFDNVEDIKVQKPAAPQIGRQGAAAPPAKRPPSTKPLPDFNEAFGTTERGRFQSPPDPRLNNKGYLDYFFDGDNPIKFDDYQI